jgi:putative solute:sodium symporter small subunit
MLQLSQKHREYWRRTLNLTIVLLAIWFVVTFVMAYFAVPLSKVVIAGFPVSFYMAAQGSLIVYVILIWYYAHKMGQLDREYGVHEGDDE